MKKIIYIALALGYLIILPVCLSQVQAKTTRTPIKKHEVVKKTTNKNIFGEKLKSKHALSCVYTIKSVTLLPCTSTSCGGISTIKVTGNGFSAKTRVELIGSGVTGSYVGGNYTTEILTDFINLPKGVYDVRVYSTTGDTKELIKTAAVTIN